MREVHPLEGRKIVILRVFDDWIIAQVADTGEYIVIEAYEDCDHTIKCLDIKTVSEDYVRPYLAG